MALKYKSENASKITKMEDEWWKNSFRVCLWIVIKCMGVNEARLGQGSGSAFGRGRAHQFEEVMLDSVWKGENFFGHLKNLKFQRGNSQVK